MRGHRFRCVSLALLASSVVGCASLARNDSEEINRLLAERHGPVLPNKSESPQLAKERIADFLNEPLTAQAAIAIAMQRSPRLQQEYARLGLARAEVLDALEISNPGVHLSRRSLSPGLGNNRSIGLSLPIADLLTLPLRSRLAKTEYQRANIEMAAAISSVAADVEAAWFVYTAQRQIFEMRKAITEGMSASAELAQRFFAAGNISELQLAREHAAASEARIASAQAQVELIAARLALNVLLGLSGEQARAWESSDQLPLPVAKEDAAETLLSLARSTNLELRAATLDSESQNKLRSSQRRWSWLGASELGFERETEVSGERMTGPSLEIELPVFNQGQARRANADALVADADARLAMTQTTFENAVVLGAEQVRELAKIVAIHREALIPQHEKIVAGSQREQNFMLIGVFELIQAKTNEYDAYQSYLEALRDYWLARIELMRVVGQRLPSDAQITSATLNSKNILKPSHDAMPMMDHSKHTMPMAPEKPVAPDQPEKSTPPTDEHSHHHGGQP